MHAVSVVAQFVAHWISAFADGNFFYVVIWGYSDYSMHFVQIFIFVWLLHCTAVASYFRAYVIWLSLFFFWIFILWITCYMRSSRHTQVFHFSIIKMHFYVHFYLTFDCYSAAVAVCVFFCHCRWMDVKLIFHYWNFFIYFFILLREMSLFTSFIDLWM